MELTEYCRSGVYLYGVISLEDLAEIYRGYEHKKISAEELKNAAFLYPKEMTVKDGCLMEEELEEEDLYLHLLENQGQLPYYLPQDKEEFLQYGKTECQDLDEHTMPLLEFFSEEMGQDMPHSLILYSFVSCRPKLANKSEDIFFCFLFYPVFLQIIILIQLFHKIRDLLHQIMVLL